MNSSAGPVAAYRRYWLPELIALVLLALASIVLFAVTDLDVETIRPFCHPELSYPWPVAMQPPWSLLYESPPWVTGSLAVAGVALFVTGVVRSRARRLRWYGGFILLCVMLGPGLIINVVLKDHWGRPRPRQLVEFGGRFEYVQPLIPTWTPSGIPCKSFPCGHCSVGYLYAIGWWLWRRRHPRWAAVSLAVGLVAGTLLGLGRMAGGAHFLSDAVWSALGAYAIAHCLYYYGLRIPAREDSRPTLYPLIEGSRRLKAATIAAAVLAGLGIIGGGLLASSQFGDLTGRVRLADCAAEPEIVEVLVDTLDVELRLVTEPRGEIESSGSLHGFGLPTNKIRASWEFVERPVPTLRYRVSLKGLFTDIDGMAHIRIPVQNLRTITVRVKQGDISVVDETGGVFAAGHLPALDLHTADGRVHQPQPRREP
jgi:membrane-associated PAP2 superfamily phosphatase